MHNKFIIAALVILLCACQSSPRKNYYVLSAASPESSGQVVDISRIIGIGPIEMADYLHRSQIVYVADDMQLVLEENDYWAEPLDKGIVRVLVLNLMQKDSSRSFVTFPWRSDSKPRYSLRLQIHSLNRNDGQASINSTWTLVDNTQRTELLRRHFIQSTAASIGVKGLTQAYSQLFAQLAERMDEELRKLPQDN